MILPEFLVHSEINKDKKKKAPGNLEIGKGMTFLQKRTSEVVAKLVPEVTRKGS